MINYYKKRNKIKKVIIINFQKMIKIFKGFYQVMQ